MEQSRILFIIYFISILILSYSSASYNFPQDVRRSACLKEHYQYIQYMPIATISFLQKIIDNYDCSQWLCKWSQKVPISNRDQSFLIHHMRLVSGKPASIKFLLIVLISHLVPSTLCVVYLTPHDKNNSVSSNLTKISSFVLKLQHKSCYPRAIDSQSPYVHTCG